MSRKKVQDGTGIGMMLVALGILAIILIEPRLLPQVVEAVAAVVAAVVHVFVTAIQSSG